MCFYLVMIALILLILALIPLFLFTEAARAAVSVLVFIPSWGWFVVVGIIGLLVFLFYQVHKAGEHLHRLTSSDGTQRLNVYRDKVTLEELQVRNLDLSIPVKEILSVVIQEESEIGHLYIHVRQMILILLF